MMRLSGVRPTRVMQRVMPCFMAVRVGRTCTDCSSATYICTEVAMHVGWVGRRWRCVRMMPTSQRHDLQLKAHEV